MGIAQIEAELKRMSPEELRRLAMNSWAAFKEKEGANPAENECVEESPELLAALDDAVRKTDEPGSRTFTPDEVRSKLREWTTR